MNERKNITAFFQEKFQDFEVEPNEIVWTNIEAKLKEKKKRRIIPFWWKFSGIAATLILGFWIFNISGFKINSAKNNSVVIENNLEKTKNQNQEVVSSENTNKSEKGNSINENFLKTNKKNKENSSILSSKKTAESEKKSSEKMVYQIVKTKNRTVNKYLKTNSETSTKVASKTDNIKNKKPEILVLNSKNIEENSKNETNNLFANNNKLDNNDIKNTENLSSEKTNKKLDSTKIAVVELNAMEKLLDEKEKQKSPEQKLNRWQVSPNIAPIYFSSTTQGSSLDQNLINNTKNYNANNVSYGIGGSYAVSKKIKIRSGVNKMSANYVTNNIVFYQVNSVVGKIANLNPNSAGISIIIENMSNVNATFGKIQDKQEGSLNQKLGYIEVPLEVSYKLLNKKIGIDIIGGMSTMFLNENGIYLQSDNLNLKIGEANNLNNIHYSTNLGLGFKYSFLKNIEAQVEPIFKYQINTFSNDANNFKPYIFGVYSGVSYRF